MAVSVRDRDSHRWWTLFAMCFALFIMMRK